MPKGCLLSGGRERGLGNGPDRMRSSKALQMQGCRAGFWGKEGTGSDSAQGLASAEVMGWTVPRNQQEGGQRPVQKHPRQEDFQRAEAPSCTVPASGTAPQRRQHGSCLDPRTGFQERMDSHRAGARELFPGCTGGLAWQQKEAVDRGQSDLLSQSRVLSKGATPRMRPEMTPLATAGAQVSGACGPSTQCGTQ